MVILMVVGDEYHKVVVVGVELEVEILTVSFSDGGEF